METGDPTFVLPAVVMPTATAAITSESEQNDVRDIVRTSNLDTIERGTVAASKMSIVNRGGHECDLCGKAFSTPSRVVAHRRFHTGEKPFHCEYCTDNFKTKKNLQDHIRIHTGEKPYVCILCGARFRQCGGLSKHRNTAHNGTGEVRNKKCRQCDEYFSDHKSLMEHRKTHNKMYVCDTCGQRFTRLHQAKIHQRLHTGEKPFSCDYCGKKFYRNTDLRVHVRIHTGEKPYQCEKCALSFSQRRQLHQHICVSDDRPTREIDCLTPPITGFSCDLCNFSTFDSDDFATHTNRHKQMQVEDLQCQTCHRIFRTKHALSVHKRTHTGARPYKCPYCQASFRQSGHMMVHCKTHTFKASQCGQCGDMLETYGAHRKHVCGEKKAHQSRLAPSTKADDACYKCAACFTTFKSLNETCIHVCAPGVVAQPISGTIYLPESIGDRSEDVVGQNGTEILLTENTNSLIDLEQLAAAYPDLFVANSKLIVEKVDCSREERFDYVPNNSCPNVESIAGSLVTMLEFGQAVAGIDTGEGTSCKNVARAEALISVAETDDTEMKDWPSDPGRVLRGNGEEIITEDGDDEMNQFLSSDADDGDGETKNVDETDNADTFTLPLDQSEAGTAVTDHSEARTAVFDQFEDVTAVPDQSEAATAVLDQSEVGTAVLDKRGTDDCREDVSDGYSLDNTAALKKIKEKTLGQEFLCQTCGKTFPLRSKLTWHIQNVHLNPKIDCQTHVDYHHAVPSFVCDDCDRCFSTKRGLQTHKKMAHSENRPFVCDLCQERFLYRNHLVRHERIAHTEQSKQVFICETCGQSYSRLAYLTRHMKRHTDQQHPWQCQFCNIQCTSGESFDKHSKSHQKDRPHKCTFCEKSFAKTSTLKQHLDSHTGSRPYACKYCDKRFRQRNHRVEHERTHIGEKPYVCELCGFSSSYRACHVYHMSHKHPEGVTVTMEDSQFVLQFETGDENNIDEVLLDNGTGSREDEQQQAAVIYVCTDQAGLVLEGLTDEELSRIKDALTNSSQIMTQQLVNAAVESIDVEES